MTLAPRTLSSVQYLRGLAALAVVLTHSSWLHLEAGEAGVDLFFVISGFIMLHVSRREVTPGTFLRARVLRVVPLYWLMTLLAAWIMAAPWDRLLRSLLFWPTQRADGWWFPVLLQGWTLNYEAFFYVCFAIALSLPARSRLPALTGSFLVVIAAIAFTAPALLSTPNVTPVMLFEFLAGAWLYRFWQAERLPGSRAGWAMLAVGTVAVLLTPHGHNVPWRPVLWGIPSLLIVAGALAVERSDALPRVPGLLAMGDASYALYLTHLLTIRAVAPILHPLPLPLALPGIVGACVTVALLTHRVVERPMARWLSDRMLRHPPTLVATP